MAEENEESPCSISISNKQKALHGYSIGQSPTYNTREQYNSVVEVGRPHGVDPILLLFGSMNGWMNTEFFSGKLTEFTIGYEHVTCTSINACHFWPSAVMRKERLSVITSGRGGCLQINISLTI